MIRRRHQRTSMLGRRALFVGFRRPGRPRDAASVVSSDGGAAGGEACSTVAETRTPAAAARGSGTIPEPRAVSREAACEARGGGEA